MKKPPVSASGQGQYRVLKLHEGPVPLDTAEPIKRGGVEHLVRHTQCLTATIPLVIPFFLNFRRRQFTALRQITNSLQASAIQQNKSFQFPPKPLHPYAYAPQSAQCQPITINLVRLRCRA